MDKKNSLCRRAAGCFLALSFAFAASLSQAQPELVVDEDTVLSGNVEGWVWVTASDVTLDCQGYEIINQFPVDQEEEDGVLPGVLIVGLAGEQLTGVTVRNCVIRDFWSGIRIAGGGSHRIIRNTIVETTPPVNGWTVRYGIRITNSTANLLFANVEDQVEGDGILLVNSTDHRVVANRVGGPGWGIVLIDSDDNNFSFNFVNANGTGGEGFHVDGSMAGNGSSGNTFRLNTIVNQAEAFRIQQESLNNVVRGNFVLRNDIGVLICSDLLASNSVASNIFLGNGQNIATSPASSDPLLCGSP